MTELEKAARQALEAMNAMLTHMGMDEDDWNRVTFDQMRRAITFLRTAIEAAEKQEPVAWGFFFEDGEASMNYLTQERPLKNGSPAKIACGLEAFVPSTPPHPQHSGNQHVVRGLG